MLSLASVADSPVDALDDEAWGASLVTGEVGDGGLGFQLPNPAGLGRGAGAGAGAALLAPAFSNAAILSRRELIFFGGVSGWSDMVDGERIHD